MGFGYVLLLCVLLNKPFGRAFHKIVSPRDEFSGKQPAESTSHPHPAAAWVKSFSLALSKTV